MSGPEEDASVVHRVAFGSCADQNKSQPIWDAIVRFRPDLFIFAGDAYYPTDPRNVEKAKKAQAKLAAIPAFQKLREQARLLGTWSEDDFGLEKPASEPGIREAVRHSYLDFFDVPKDSPRRTRPGIYDVWASGPSGRRLQVILLDTRFNRTPLRKKTLFDRSDGPYASRQNPDGVYLGEEQWAFLREKLLELADVRLIVSDIQVIAEEGDYEKWSNFPGEKARLLQLLRDTKAGGVVVLSGERHVGELSRTDAGLGYPLYDLTASGLNMAAYNVGPASKNRYRVENPVRGNNFGTIILEWERAEPRISLEVRDDGGNVGVSQKIPLTALRPAAAQARPEKN